MIVSCSFDHPAVSLRAVQLSVDSVKIIEATRKRPE